ncbi:Leucine rich repeat [Phytophthora infestans]|uniref:Leucine rich repeat n=1 Tax=Phytophthora infestans TaxID=4787 RepID=A0A833TMG0_PHYIN|nr:Leucine rich repeat [Phytophthora infestans]
MGAGVSTKAFKEFDAALKDTEVTGKLAVRDCDLFALPPEVLERATHLTELRLEHAKLKHLPASFGSLILLERLSLAGNELETLPLSFHELQRLEELDLSCNALSSLLGNFCNLGSLRRLCMYENALKKLPREFGALKSLEVLDMHNNALKRLPKSFPCLTSLTRLELSRNKLRKLPQAFGNLSALLICNLGRNMLRELPDYFGMLGALEVLSLSYNALAHRSQEFIANRQQDRVLPGPDQPLTALVTLTYAENRLRLWRPGEKSILDEEAPESVYKLGTSDEEDTNEVGITPSNPLVTLAAIQYLDLSDNALEYLPSRGWGRLETLLHLKLSRNRLHLIPPEVGSLPRLQRLDIAANKLKTLPSSLFSNKSLAYLDAQQNTLQELPDNAGECEALVRLVLTKNRDLRGLPRSICRLALLEELRVDKSCFLALGEELTAFCRELAYFSAE